MTKVKAEAEQSVHLQGAVRDLKDKVAWITGGGTGIGQAAAIALAGAGMKVVLSGRRKSALEKTSEIIRTAGGEPVIEVLDVRNAQDNRKVVDRIHQRFGRLDIAVLSAGMNVKKRAWTDVDDQGWDEVLGIDLSGAFYGCKAILPIMRSQKSGLIINVASWAGVYVSRLVGPAYNAAKHGLVAMSDSINIEESTHGIRSCALCPGEVSTPIMDSRPVPVTDEEKAAMLQPEDVGETILFLARMQERVCINQLVISPTANRFYAGIS